MKFEPECIWADNSHVDAGSKPVVIVVSFIEVPDNFFLAVMSILARTRATRCPESWESHSYADVGSAPRASLFIWPNDLFLAVGLAPK